MLDLICPYCGKKVFDIVNKHAAGAHYRICKKQNNVESTNPSFVDVAIKNFGEYATKEFIEEKIKEGLPVTEIDEKYLKGYTRKLGKFYGLRFQTIKESASNPRTRKKYEQTCLEKYGAINTCAAGTPGRKKAEKTMKERYGVINFFGIENFQQILKEKMGEEEYHRRKSDRSHKVWENKTPEERNRWILSSIWNETRNWKIKRNGNCSKSEIDFVARLVNYGFEIETQFKLLKGIDINKCKRYYFYDVRIKDSNILIEFQGDYWHANPRIYKEDDLISHPKGKIPVKDIWEKDRKKKERAERDGYKLIYIWESEFYSNCFEEILFNKLVMEADYGNYKIEEHQED